MYLKKQDLSELNYKELVSLTDAELSEFSQKHLQPHFLWLLPQLVANFGSWTLVETAGQIDIKATLQQNVGQDPKQQVLWKLTRIPRSDLVRSQVGFPEYATFTPIILMGFKRYQGVQYERWRGLDHLEWILEPKLLEAICVDYSDLGSDELLDIRTQGLMNKTGQKAGTLKPPESTWSLTGVKDTKLGHLPKLTQTMLCQIWIAHPSKRTHYMILDPKNWDNMPEPIISAEIFQPQDTKQTKQTNTLPWL